ncbi:MAG: hypothetical protein WAX04_02475 [Oscillospiraceae bacterium]
MKQNTGRLSAFILGFLITIMLAVLVSFILTSLYRMENTMSPNQYTVLDVKKNSENEIKIVALNKEYIYNFGINDQTSNIFSTYDVLIPAEIRTFFCVVKGGIDAAGVWVDALL